MVWLGDILSDDDAHTYFTVHLPALEGVEELELLRFKIPDSVNWLLDSDALLGALAVATLSQLGHLFVH